MILSDHALEEMAHSAISEEEVQQCLEHGNLIAKQRVKGELRYLKRIEFKERKIIVIYTYVGDEEKVITTYPIKRKKQWTTQNS